MIVFLFASPEFLTSPHLFCVSGSFVSFIAPLEFLATPFLCVLDISRSGLAS